MPQFYKGQQVRSGQQTGIVLRMFGNKAVQVSTKRVRLVMAGTFPDKPIGETVQYVKETWPVSSVTTE